MMNSYQLMKPKGIIIILIFLLLRIQEATAQPLTFSIDTITAPHWAWQQPLYEVDIERITPEGTFNAFGKQLPRLKTLGVGIIWLMPIHQRGSFRVAPELMDRLGGTPIPVPEKYRYVGRPTSPYNIHDHYSVNPKYGTPEDLKALIDKAHQLGMYVILDWVINHTSWDHVLIDEHPEYYARNDNGSVMYTAPWQDIAQLDYTNKDVWEYMTDLSCHWVKEYDLDGFRTDVADRIPAEFWKQLRPKLNAIKPVFLLAEGHDPAVHPAHDASYDWFLPTAFWSVKEGKRSTDVFDTLLAREQRLYPEGFLRMRHATNHDVQRSGFAYPSMAKYYDQVFDEAYFKKNSLTNKFGDGLKAYMVLCTTLPNSVPMLWNGQEIGIIEDTPEEIAWKNNDWTDFYTKLFALYRDNNVLFLGDYHRIASPGHPGIYAFARTKGKQKVIVVINCSDQKQQVTLDHTLLRGKGREVFTGEKYSMNGSVNLSLERWDFKAIHLED